VDENFGKITTNPELRELHKTSDPKAHVEGRTVEYFGNARRMIQTRGVKYFLFKATRGKENGGLGQNLQKCMETDSRQQN
jgi:hypothetical protein